MNSQIEVAILGGAGMGAGELLRYLLGHPAVRIAQVASRSHTGQPISLVHPHLVQLSGLRFTDDIAWDGFEASGPLVLFAALGHGELAARYPALDRKLRELAGRRPVLLVDVSADFRLDDEAAWAKYYGGEHPCPRHLADFAYGLPELDREALAGATRIASPGCFATALNLSVLPLAGRLDGRRISIAAMTGSSGSGKQPSETTHHPHRHHDLRAYGMLRHRHQAELEMVLGRAGSRAEVAFVPHSAPLVRGILATLFIECADAGEAGEFAGLYGQYYAGEPFVDLLQESPRVATVAGSNRAQLCVLPDGRSLVVICAIDNLGKGLAGQAVQNMNIALGLPEATGLLSPALFP